MTGADTSVWHPPGMHARIRRLVPRWTSIIPVLALVALVLSWGRHLGGGVVVVVGLILAAAVLAAVHHAEVVADRVGEPFGSRCWRSR